MILQTLNLRKFFFVQDFRYFSALGVGLPFVAILYLGEDYPASQGERSYYALDLPYLHWYPNTHTYKNITFHADIVLSNCTIPSNYVVIGLINSSSFSVI